MSAPVPFSRQEPRMARDDFESQWVGNWSTTENLLWNDAFGGEFNDSTAQALYHAGYFDQDYSTDQRVAIREALDQYMMDEFGIDFNESFDWDAWRESYGEAA